MPFMKVRDGRMHYEVLGEGPPVLLVHGFTNFGLVWADQATALVYAGYKVIMPDLAGHGLSSPATEDIPVATLAADMVALLDHLDVARAVICGLSLGGMVAQEMMAEHRTRLVAAIVVDSCADASGEKNVAAVTEWIRMFREPDGQMIRQEAAWPNLLQAPFRESPSGVSFNATWRNISAPRARPFARPCGYRAHDLFRPRAFARRDDALPRRQRRVRPALSRGDVPGDRRPHPRRHLRRDPRRRPHFRTRQPAALQRPPLGVRGQARGGCRSLSKVPARNAGTVQTFERPRPREARTAIV